MKKRSRLTVGIDPGLTGAMGVVDGSEYVAHHRLPVVLQAGKRIIEPTRFRDLIRQYAGADFCIEQQGVRKGNSLTSCFSIGRTYATLCTVLTLEECRWTFVSPVKWKADMGLSNPYAKKRRTTKEQRKAEAVAMARRLWPDAEFKTHDEAEALLIAEWRVRR